MRTPIAFRRLVSTWTAVLLGGAALAGAAPPPDRPNDLAALAGTVLHGRPAAAEAAVAALRDAGPAGMAAMLAAAGPCLAGPCRNANGVEAALDRVCGVRDCAAIRLFWYTDLDAAEAAARATGKPILSLRLMGRLDEADSYANGRFFRTVFYADRKVNALLRDRFVLHWRSVQPDPETTVDFGSLERTLAGNSIHSVLDSRGRLVEALPGLSGPEAFQAALERSLERAANAEHLDDAQLASWRRWNRRTQVQEWAASLKDELARLDGKPKADEAEERCADPETFPTTFRSLFGPGFTPVGRPLREVVPAVSDDQLQALASQRRPRIHLDAASRAVLLRQQGVTDPAEADRLIEDFEAEIALDEVTNQYRLGPAILDKLNESEDPLPM